MPDRLGYLALSFELRDLDPLRAETACQGLGALAVTYSDTRDDAVLEPGVGEVRLWPATRLQALFAGDADGAALSARLAAALELEPDRVALQRLADRAWEREWLRDFHALRFGARLWVCPRHEQVSEPGAVVLTLDPGLAFGTGTHPSTALCLEWLDERVVPGSTFIDYGSGSGILGIAAALLGAARVTAFDLDPQACLATAENAAANGLSGRLTVCSSAADLPAPNDMLVANILAGPLCELAPHFSRLVRPGGKILLAGILAEQAEVVAGAYAPWFHTASWREREGWLAVEGTRN